MKKGINIVLLILLSCTIFLLGYTKKGNIPPNYLYQVYLDDLTLGLIESKEELEEYINQKGEDIKQQYRVDNVYAPAGIEIRKISTYNGNIISIDEVFENLKDLKPFTIDGYQFTIKKEEENLIIYTTEESVFKKSLENAIMTFTGKENYKNYLEGTQTEIVDTGSYIERAYIEESLTMKKVKIPISERIYIDEEDLSKYILFGTTEEQRKYVVKLGDTIESVSTKNKINVQEFLTANPTFTSTDNILIPGEEVSITAADPIISVVVESTVVRDQAAFFKVEEKFTETLNLGQQEVVQQGKEGVSRVTSDVKTINGNIVHAKSTKNDELVPPINKIIHVGTKYIPHVGGAWWVWPTGPGWGISSDFGWRVNTYTGQRDFHPALDIYNRIGTPIYASNNGTIIFAGWGSSYGYHIMINHNNGYYTLYAHLSGFAGGLQVDNVVAGGQLIGYMGMTGNASGPHLHYEIWYGGTPNSSSGYYINPWDMHR